MIEFSRVYEIVAEAERLLSEYEGLPTITLPELAAYLALIGWEPSLA